MRFAASVLVLSLAAAGSAVAAEANPYIFDVLPLQPYKGTLARLVRSPKAPDWVKAIASKGEGTAVPSKTVDIGGTALRLDHVCKPHDCADNTIDILWSTNGGKAWAALVVKGKPPVMLGDPPPAQAKALTEAVAAAR